MEVQKYLRSGKALTDLKEELGIEYKVHPELPLVILTYNQIESPKAHPIVMECRGLVLELDTWDVVLKPFGRFFNHGEVLDETCKFDWDGELRGDSKEDGSLILVGMYNDHMLTNTRGSWGDGICGYSDKTWRELILENMPAKFREDIPNLPRMTYIFELCTLHNKVVRTYKEPMLYLLGMFHIDKDGKASEQFPAFVDAFAFDYWIPRPKSYKIRNITDVYNFIEKMGEKDPTFEGFVLVDEKMNRLKVKSKLYVSLHMLRGEGDNLFNPKYLLPWVLKNEGGELLTYFPEVGPNYDALRDQVECLYDGLLDSWREAKDIEDQKEFALKITKEKPTPFASILFRLKQNGTVGSEEELRKAFLEAEAHILKVIKG